MRKTVVRVRLQVHISIRTKAGRRFSSLGIQREKPSVAGSTQNRCRSDLIPGPIRNTSRTGTSFIELIAPYLFARLRVLLVAEALDRLGGDEELFRELCGIFLEESPKLLQKLREAIAEGDPVAKISKDAARLEKEPA